MQANLWRLRRPRANKRHVGRAWVMRRRCARRGRQQLASRGMGRWRCLSSMAKEGCPRSGLRCQMRPAMQRQTRRARNRIQPRGVAQCLPRIYGIFSFFVLVLRMCQVGRKPLRTVKRWVVEGAAWCHKNSALSLGRVSRVARRGPIEGGTEFRQLLAASRVSGLLEV